MDELQDFELRKTADEPSPVTSLPPPRVGQWVVVTMLLAGAAVAAYIAFAWRPRPAPTPNASSAPAATAPAPPASLGGAGDPITLPPLDASDALVRTLVQALSASPAVTAWLTTNGLIRNFTVAVANIADGATPAKHLSRLRPSSSFVIVERNGNLSVDPRSYDRYNAIADAIASLEPAAAARLYATLKPRIEEAHRDLGSADQSFDRTLERAIVALLNTPVADAPARLTPKGIGYAYADDRLESLTAAQKQLLRMGPRNERLVKAKLREIALALGMSPAQLPVPPP